MTINQLLRQSGVAFNREDAERIGYKVKVAARKASVKPTKIEELLLVNDYPESFSETMQQIAIEHFTKKVKK